MIATPAEDRPGDLRLAWDALQERRLVRQVRPGLDAPARQYPDAYRALLRETRRPHRSPENRIERPGGFCYPRTMRRTDVLCVAGLLLATLTAGCKGGMRGPEVAHPLTGTTRYLCCNLYYEKTKTTDVGYQIGTKVPFGTRVHVERVRRDSVELTPEGHPTITLLYKHGDRAVPFDTYLDRLLVENDPRGRLRKVAAKRVDAIERGAVEKGMTRDQVLMSRGIPPAHRTPDLESPTWTYWQNRWDTLVVYFVGDKVDRIAR